MSPAVHSPLHRGPRVTPGSPTIGELKLAVGPFASDGTAFHELVYQGQKLAESRSEGTRTFWRIRSQPSMYVVRALYRLEGTPHFAVHAVLFSRRDARPKMAHLEAYPEWEGVLEHHPDLAREAIGPKSSAEKETMPVKIATPVSRAF
ncbi:MAG: hypothetical protein KGI98_17250 [Euryarchaeota archaeon]|nr:hypothetical protein [Euryarchaeota archaeon]